MSSARNELAPPLAKKRLFMSFPLQCERRGATSALTMVTVGARGMEDLKGKTALVTGASGGIGRSIVALLRDKGVVVAGTDVNGIGCE